MSHPVLCARGVYGGRVVSPGPTKCSTSAIVILPAGCLGLKLAAAWYIGAVPVPTAGMHQCEIGPDPPLEDMVTPSNSTVSLAGDTTPPPGRRSRDLGAPTPCHCIEAR